MTEQPRLTSTCRTIFVFEVGWALDLAAAERQFGVSGERQVLRRGPTAVHHGPNPIRVAADAPPFRLGRFSTEPSVDLVLYDLGAVTVSYRIPASGTFQDLLALSLALRDRETLRLDARARVEAVIERLGSAVQKPKVADLTEDYTIYGITAITPPLAAAVVCDTYRELIAQILRREPGALSPEEIREATDVRISFGLGDMTVVDWDAALVLDPDPEDVAAVLDFANVQLLEMRYLDQQLDEAIERSYPLLAQKRGWGGFTPARLRTDVGAVAELQLESAVLLERVTNALKFFGEEYLTRIYRLASRRFQLPELDASITRKLATIESIYQKMGDKAAARRMELLEWVVIILIAMEIVLSLTRR
jgi:hypothetical protein